MRRANEHVVTRLAVGRRVQVVNLTVDEVHLFSMSQHRAIALFRFVLHLDGKNSSCLIQQFTRCQKNFDLHCVAKLCVIMCCCITHHASSVKRSGMVCPLDIVHALADRVECSDFRPKCNIRAALIQRVKGVP